MREWTDIGFSSIYYLLGKMEKAGLVEGRAEDSGESGAQTAAPTADRAARGPARKVYAPTAEGFSAWQEASLQALSMPFYDRSKAGVLVSRMTSDVDSIADGLRRVLESREFAAEMARRTSAAKVGV